MKSFTSFLLLTFLLSGCYSRYPLYQYGDQTTVPSTLTQIPTPPVEQLPKVIFAGEKIPDEPYFKVDILEVSGYETKAMMIDLQVLGKQRGVDAILIVANNTITESFNEEIYTSQKLSGVGIKFLKNVDYLEDCIKQLNVIALDTSTNKYDTVGIINTDWQGNLLGRREGDNLYWKILFNFSEQHLYYEQSQGWKFKKSLASNGKTIIRRNLTGNSGYLLKSVRVELFRERITLIEVNKIHNVLPKTNIKFNYDGKNVLVSKEIDSENLGKFLQKITYQDNGLPLRYDFYKLGEDGKERFYFKAVFENFEEGDLKELLELEE